MASLIRVLPSNDCSNTKIVIAVSSNNREVVVYHFGCAESTPTSHACETSEDGLLRSPTGHMHFFDSIPMLYPTVISTADESRSKNHGQNFRKILKLGAEGHNIPSIDFTNDSNGEAHSILAVDINGNLWILDIWRDGEPDGITLIPCVQRQPTRGHGVM